MLTGARAASRQRSSSAPGGSLTAMPGWPARKIGSAWRQQLCALDPTPSAVAAAVATVFVQPYCCTAGWASPRLPELQSRGWAGRRRPTSNQHRAGRCSRRACSASPLPGSRAAPWHWTCLLPSLSTRMLTLQTQKTTVGASAAAARGQEAGRPFDSLFFNNVHDFK